MDEPSSTKLRIVKSRISEAAWNKRVKAARRDEQKLLEVLDDIQQGASLNEAIRNRLPKSKRSWAMHHLERYKQEGLEALIDARTPREPQVSAECKMVLEAAREANPELTVDEAVAMLQRRKQKRLPSQSTVERIFRQVDGRVKSQQRRAKRLRAQAEGRELPEEVIEQDHAGGELLLAAELETKMMAALTDEVEAYAKAANDNADTVYIPDLAYRNRKGQFTRTYNRRRRRKRGQEIASYLRSAQEKAEGRPPNWSRFVKEQRKTLEKKIRALTFSPLLAGSKGWAALRAPDLRALSYLAGFDYLPATLSKFVSAAAISGLGPVLLSAVGRRGHEVAQQRWGEAGAMAALFVDNHAKEVWSSLFTKAGKVSHRNRVMPCITTTYVHTGAGTPLVMSVQSGAAPLAPRLVELVKQAEEELETEVGRAVVIDAEGSTFDILESFSRQGRAIVTPLKPSRAPALELRYDRGSYYRPFRDNDELRVARGTLRHKTTRRSLDVGVLLVRREHRDQETVLLTTGLDLGLCGRELAELYYLRWPIQEIAFKEWAEAVKLDQHRGNCGRMVANVAVVTELERLQARIRRCEEELDSFQTKGGPLEQEAKVAEREHRRADQALQVRRSRLDRFVEQGRTAGKMFSRCAVEHQQALHKAEQAEQAYQAASAALEANRTHCADLEARLDKDRKRERHLQPQRTIRELDVAQDMILTATKLAAANLITFVLREYLGDKNMTPQTFVSRVLSFRGRREVYKDQERVLFYENERDPEMTQALQEACRRLNKRKLKRDDRTVTYCCCEAPCSN
jgi:hypothetical protein